jgi:hypothetical protein
MLGAAGQSEMNFEIDIIILDSTHRCRCDFSCLKGDKECFCQVDSLVSDKLLFIKDEKHNVCDYMTSFGYSYFCNCPTRKEIFKRYKV